MFWFLSLAQLFCHVIVFKKKPPSRVFWSLCFIQLPLCFVHSCYIFLFARVFLNWSALDLSGPPYNRSVIDITEQHSPFSKVREQHISKSGVYFQKSRPSYFKKESTDLILSSLIRQLFSFDQNPNS